MSQNVAETRKSDVEGGIQAEADHATISRSLSDLAEMMALLPGTVNYVAIAPSKNAKFRKLSADESVS